MTPTEELPIKYKTWTLKPTSFIHSEVMKRAIHMIRLEDLPSYGKVPEGYFFISNHPTVFDAHYYDAERWYEIKKTQWKVWIDNEVYEHWKVYLYFPANHLYDHSNLFIVVIVNHVRYLNLTFILIPD